MPWINVLVQRFLHQLMQTFRETFQVLLVVFEQRPLLLIFQIIAVYLKSKKDVSGLVFVCKLISKAL